MGYHPLYAVVSGLFRMRERPFLIGGLLIIMSYFYAAVRREPRFEDKEFIKTLQQWQRQRLQQLPKRLIQRLLGATHGVS
jgi:biofilm PGA synthesis N-glycosyltransferase PgaC